MLKWVIFTISFIIAWIIVGILSKAIKRSLRRDPSQDEIFNILRRALCNGTTDCENYPECVNEGEMDGCPPLDLAKEISERIRSNPNDPS